MTDISCQVISCDGFIGLPGKHALPKGELENHAHKVMLSSVTPAKRKDEWSKAKDQKCSMFLIMFWILAMGNLQCFP